MQEAPFPLTTERNCFKDIYLFFLSYFLTVTTPTIWFISASEFEFEFALSPITFAKARWATPLKKSDCEGVSVCQNQNTLCIILYYIILYYIILLLLYYIIVIIIILLILAAPFDKSQHCVHLFWKQEPERPQDGWRWGDIWYLYVILYLILYVIHCPWTSSINNNHIETVFSLMVS